MPIDACACGRAHTWSSVHYTLRAVRRGFNGGLDRFFSMAALQIDKIRCLGYGEYLVNIG